MNTSGQTWKGRLALKPPSPVRCSPLYANPLPHFIPLLPVSHHLLPVFHQTPHTPPCTSPVQLQAPLPPGRSPCQHVPRMPCHQLRPRLAMRAVLPSPPHPRRLRRAGTARPPHHHHGGAAGVRENHRIGSSNAPGWKGPSEVI